MKAVVLCVLLLAPLVLARTQVQGDEFAKLKHMFAGLFSGGRMGADVAAAGAPATPGAPTTAATAPAPVATTPAAATTTTTTTTTTTPDVGSPPEFDTRHIRGSKAHLSTTPKEGGSWLKATVDKLRNSLDKRNRVCWKSRKLHHKFNKASANHKKAAKKLSRRQNYYTSVAPTSSRGYNQCVAAKKKIWRAKSAEFKAAHPNWKANARARCQKKEEDRRAKVIAALQAEADKLKAILDKIGEKYQAKKSACKSRHQSFKQELQAAIDQTSQRKRQLSQKKNDALNKLQNLNQKIQKLIQLLKERRAERNATKAKHQRLAKKLRVYRITLTHLRKIAA